MFSTTWKFLWKHATRQFIRLEKRKLLVKESVTIIYNCFQYVIRFRINCKQFSFANQWPQVTWKRLNDVHPLTIGLQPFLVDPRIRVDHNQRVNEWNLVISEVIEEDEGVYQCQIITKDNVEAYNITLKLKRNRLLLLHINI